MNSDNFKVTDENGTLREANIITVFETEGKNYVIYSIDRDEDNANIFVSKLGKDDNKNDILVDITSQEEKERINKIVKDIMTLPIE